MLTSGVDETAIASPDLWLTAAELADARGCSRQAIHQALQRWADLGSPVSTRSRGRELEINVTEYERRHGEVVDLPHAAAEKTKAELKNADQVSPAGESTFGREQARKAGYEAELKRIELEKALGRLVETAEVSRAAETAAANLAGLLSRLHMRADEVHAAGQRDGISGTRAALRAVQRDFQAQIAEEFAKMASAAIAEGDEAAA